MPHKCETIDDYIRGCTKMVVPLLEELRAFIHATSPGVTESMQYGVPVFKNTHGVPVIYLFGSKGHVNVGFLRCSVLKDPHAVLKGSGKPSKHIKVYPDQPLDKTLLSGFVNQCKSMKP